MKERGREGSAAYVYLFVCMHRVASRKIMIIRACVGLNACLDLIFARSMPPWPSF